MSVCIEMLLIIIRWFTNRHRLYYGRIARPMTAWITTAGPANMPTAQLFTYFCTLDSVRLRNHVESAQKFHTRARDLFKQYKNKSRRFNLNSIRLITTSRWDSIWDFFTQPQLESRGSHKNNKIYSFTHVWSRRESLVNNENSINRRNETESESSEIKNITIDR